MNRDCSPCLAAFQQPPPILTHFSCGADKTIKRLAGDAKFGAQLGDLGFRLAHRGLGEAQLGGRHLERATAAAAQGTLPDAAIEDGRLTISPLRRSTPDEAEELKARLYALLPRIRITDLLAEVSAWTGFADRFVHARTGMVASDQPALMGAILADGTNLGLARMAESSRGLTHARLLWTAEWHIRDETYAGALAAIVDHHHAHPLSRLWGPGDTSSSDGQFFRAGGRGEARADHNARYGSEPGVLFSVRPVRRAGGSLRGRPLVSISRRICRGVALVMIGPVCLGMDSPEGYMIDDVHSLLRVKRGSGPCRVPAHSILRPYEPRRPSLLHHAYPTGPNVTEKG